MKVAFTLIFLIGVLFARAQDTFHIVLQAGGVETVPVCVSAGTDSSYIIAGHTILLPTAVNQSQMFMAKVRTDGTPVFAQSFDIAGTGNVDKISKILPLPAGEFILIGYSNSSNNDHAAMVGRFSANGQPVWIRQFREPSLQFRLYLHDGLIDANNQDVLVLAGWQNGKDWLMKMDLSGNVLNHVLIDCGPIEYSPKMSITQMETDYLVIHPFPCILNCGILFYRITANFGIESAKVLPLSDQPMLSISSFLSSGSENLFFTASSSQAHGSDALLDHLNWSTGNAYLRTLSFPVGYRGAANSIQFHPTKGLEFSVSGAVASTIDSRGFALICDDSLRPFVSKWTSASQRIRSMNLSPIQHNNKMALAGIQDISNGNDQIRTFVNILGYDGNIVCGDTLELTYGKREYSTTPTTVTVLPLANTPGGLVQPIMTHYTDWEQNCLPTSIRNSGVGERIRMFPNPARDFLQIENLPPNAQVRVSNSMGQVIPFQLMNGKSDVKHLPNGVYYISVWIETGIQHLKWIKLAGNQ